MRLGFHTRKKIFLSAGAISGLLHEYLLERVFLVCLEVKALRLYISLTLTFRDCAESCSCFVCSGKENTIWRQSGSVNFGHVWLRVMAILLKTGIPWEGCRDELQFWNTAHEPCQSSRDKLRQSWDRWNIAQLGAHWNVEWINSGGNKTGRNANAFLLESGCSLYI